MLNMKYSYYAEYEIFVPEINDTNVLFIPDYNYIHLFIIFNFWKLQKIV